MFGYRVNQGQLILFQRCRAISVPFAFACLGGASDSGIAVVACTAEYATPVVGAGLGNWTHALLFDGVRVLHREGAPRLEFMDYGASRDLGGWGTANSVAWNCNLGPGTIVLQHPPSAENYAIGCSATVSAEGLEAGYTEGNNQPGLEPASLYAAELKARRTEANP